MKTRLSFALPLLVVTPLTAAITPYSEDFSSGSGSLTGWTDIGSVATSIQYSNATNDGDAGTYDVVDSDGPGDGVAGDGALLFNSQDGTPQNEEIAHTFGGTISLGESYTLDVACFNNNGSYNRYSVSLWNKTDDIMLATTGFIGLNGSVVGCRESQLTVLPGLADAGDELEVRILEDGDASSRDVWIDSISLSVSAAPATLGPLQVADLRLDADTHPGVFTYFDPGFGPLATRAAPSTAVAVSCEFSGTSQNPGDAPPDSGTDIGLRTFSDRTSIRTLNRYASDPDGPGGVAGPQTAGAVQWKIDLNDIADYLATAGRQLDSLDLRLVTNPSDDTPTYDVYISYTLAGEGMTLTDIDPDFSTLNYNTFWFPSQGQAEGNVVGGTHKILKLGHAGDLDLTTDLAAAFNAGVREVNLIISSGAFLSSDNIVIEDGSGLSFSATTLATGITAVSEDFSSGAGSITGWTSSGPVETTITHTTQANDGDNGTYDAGNSDGPGDDSAGDGALLFDSVNSTPADEEITYVFPGLMDVGETYTLDIACYNPNSSYNSYSVSLWNKTDGVQLATSGTIGLNGNTIGCRETQLSHIPTMADHGDVLEVRITENHDSDARDVAVDSFSLAVGTPPADTGLLQLVDLRLPADTFSGDFTYFDPGFGPLATRSAPDSGPAAIPATFQGTSQNPGGTADPLTDIGVRTYSASTNIQDLNRYTSSTDGGTTGPGRVGAVQWTIDLGQVSDYLDASGKQLDALGLRLVTHPSDTGKTYDVYLSYTSATDGIELTDISSDNADWNYDTFWWPSYGMSDGDVIGTTHKILKIGQTGDMDLSTDLAPLFADGVRELNLILVSGDFFSGTRTIAVQEGSGVTFRASDGASGTPFDVFMSGYPSLTGDDALPGSDPDADGLSNVAEFLMGGTAPDDSSDGNGTVGKIIDGHLTLSLLVPSGASFTGSPSPAATVEGVNVGIGGSLDLSAFGEDVEETTVNPGLPGAPSGYDWHAFRLVDDIATQPIGFLRASFEQP